MSPDSLLPKTAFVILVLAIATGVVSVLVFVSYTSGVCRLEWRPWLEPRLLKQEAEVALTRPPLWVSVGASVTWCWAALGSDVPPLGLFPGLENREEEDSAPSHLLTLALFRGFRVAWSACLAQARPESAQKHVCVPSMHPATTKG